jgi:hypothetical protein
MSDEIVKQILAEHANAPLAHSAEWTSARASSVGGSDVATILGLNPYRKRCNFIAEKCGIGPAFQGNQATRWGTVMERATEAFTRAVLQMPGEIHALGSIQTSIEGLRYTPDGLGIVHLCNTRDELRAFIAVFEFKSPFRTIPDGKIPKHYAPQLQTGLLALPRAHIGIFTNCSFRKCTAADFNFSLTYDTIYHSGDQRKPATDIYALGTVYFTASAEELQAWHAGQYAEQPDDALIYNGALDVGAAGARLTDRVFELASLGRLTAHHSAVQLNIPVVEQMQIIRTHRGHPAAPLDFARKIRERGPDWRANPAPPDDQSGSPTAPLAFMNWKLVKADIITMDRAPGWAGIVKPAVDETLACVRDIQSKPDPYIAYQERFGQQADPVDMLIMGAASGEVEI